MNVRGKLVVVSGASSGIGASLARALGARGARVVLLARRKEKLEAVAADVEKAGGEAHIIPVDLSDMEAASAAGKAILELGTPDVVVNNAGAGEWRYVDETEPAEVVSMMALPYFASFWLTRAVIEPMMARGSGLVLMVNSPAWMMGWSGSTGYACARAAQHQFAESLREDMRGTGIVVSEVTLGEVSSDYFKTQAASHERLPSIANSLIGVITPEQAGDYIVHAIEKERERVMGPFMVGALYRLDRWFPYLVRPFIRATQHKR
ncbi:MAG: SDR family NAD(P)-dependent oxidoreductase [Deltaproteobacteria bacterium]|nr:MAG: SDR family NAD(P)-dependent oxidoreductase [Deltaproteobacteria bacterium]